MALRNNEIYEAIRRDDVAYLMGTRCESILELLIDSDIPDMLKCDVTPLMVAAYYGSFKCFSFLLKKGNTDYVVRKERV